MSWTAKWIINAVDEDSAVRLARSLRIPLPIARLLVQRGIDDADSADRFLHPRLSNMEDPFGLPDMRAAVERIWTAIHSGQKITVHGDYDVDGVTSTALLVKVLDDLGADTSAFIPHREEDGYGLGLANIKACLAEHGTQLMVSVDCGTGSVEAAEFARESGVDLIVTDHHEPSGQVAQALAVVNPKLIDDDDPAKNLAGVGVVFKLCHALLIHARAHDLPMADLDLRKYIDLVALGTVADIVPLTGENRALVRYGLQLMENTNNVGLKALIDCAGVKPPITCSTLAFQLAPRINAVGRIGSAHRALDLLMSEDIGGARELADLLDSENRERQGIEKEVLKSCLAQIEDKFDPARDFALVAAGAGWHRGVVGIVASRVMRRYHRPAIVIGVEDGRGHGSGRSIEGFSLVRALEKCGENLAKFGGHDMAAGLEIEADKLAEFNRQFNSVAAEMLSHDDLVPTQRVDAWIEIEDVGPELYEAQNMLAPFGAGNHAPIWALSGVRFMEKPRQVGKGHLKALVGKGNTVCDAIGFNMWREDLPEGPVDIACKLDKNEFRGRVSYQLVIYAIRSHEHIGNRDRVYGSLIL